MSQQAIYRALTPALALREFAADAERALAAGFQPSSQSWSQDGPDAVLTVAYEPTPNRGAAMAPITSVTGPVDVSGKARFKQKKWIAVSVATVFVLGLAAIGSSSPRQSTPDAPGVAAATVVPTGTVAPTPEATPTATQTQAVTETSATTAELLALIPAAIRGTCAEIISSNDGAVAYVSCTPPGTALAVSYELYRTAGELQGGFATDAEEVDASGATCANGGYTGRFNIDGLDAGMLACGAGMYEVVWADIDDNVLGTVSEPYGDLPVALAWWQANGQIGVESGGLTQAMPTPKPTAKPTPKPTPRPTARPTQRPRATAAPNNCHPSYRGACLKRGIGDYDCAGGSGNGPNYVGFVRVVGYDEFGLDRDDDGLGCE
jgi:hypothetical protein